MWSVGDLLKERFDKFVRLKFRQIFETFAETNELHRESELFRDGDDDAPFGAAIEFGEDDAGAAGGMRKPFGLTDGILAGGRVEHQEDFMRSVGNLFRDDPFEFL